MSKLQNNTTSLQNLLEQVNTLPEAENLDVEISTQSTLLSEQDAKIAELTQILANKAGGGSNLNVANIIFDGSYGTTLKYMGVDGLTTFQGKTDSETIQVIIPSICFIGAKSIDTGFADYKVSGGCSTLFNNSFMACVEITASDANIRAVSYMSTGGSEM